MKNIRVSTSGLILAGLSVLRALENLLEEFLEMRLGLSGYWGALLAGAAVAMLLFPFRSTIARTFKGDSSQASLLEELEELEELEARVPN